MPTFRDGSKIILGNLSLTPEQANAIAARLNREALMVTTIYGATLPHHPKPILRRQEVTSSSRHLVSVGGGANLSQNTQL